MPMLKANKRKYRNYPLCHAWAQAVFAEFWRRDKSAKMSGGDMLRIVQESRAPSASERECRALALRNVNDDGYAALPNYLKGEK